MNGGGGACILEADSKLSIRILPNILQEEEIQPCTELLWLEKSIVIANKTRVESSI